MASRSMHRRAASASLGAICALVLTLFFTAEDSRVFIGGSTRSTSRIPTSPLTLHVLGRSAYISAFDVDVKGGLETDFIAASIANAKKSIYETYNQRYDLLESVDKPGSFRLVEIYRNPAGVDAHKSAEHYNTWTQTIAKLQDKPIKESAWDAIYPSVASQYASPAIIHMRSLPTYLDITHSYFTVKPGQEAEFIAASREHAAAALNEPNNIRFDVMRSVEDTAHFMYVKVYKTADDAKEHLLTQAYNTWDKTVASMTSGPPVVKRYKNHFPNYVAPWMSAAVIK